MRKIKGLDAKLEMHPSRRVPQRLYEIKNAATADDPKESADALLKQIAPDLKIEPDLSQLEFDKVNETILGSHVLYQQHLNGVPISDAWIRVDIDKTGNIYNVQNDLVPTPVTAQAAKSSKAAETGKPAITAKQAKEVALQTTPEAFTTEPELVYYPNAGMPTLAWKLITKTDTPPTEFKYYIDAADGRILEKINLLKTAEGRGRVFDPNPVAVLNDTNLSDSGNIPDMAYREVSLLELAETGFLDGPYVSTRDTPNRAQRPTLDFLYSRTDRGFKEVMVYYHIDRVQRFIQQLGFTNVLNRPISVHIDGRSDDNSHYSPTTKSLVFGTGGVDDAEDAEIILHEYGHAIQDDQVPGFGQGDENRAMGEGFGDFLAAAFFAASKAASLQPTVGNWDAVSYSGDEPPCLRRLDSNKKYPRDIVSEEHADGEIWSACLWELYGAIGSTPAIQLVIAHHFLLTRNSSFEAAGNAMITADQNLNQGRNVGVIRDIFVRRGIFPNQKRNNNRAGVPFAEIANGNGHGDKTR